MKSSKKISRKSFLISFDLFLHFDFLAALNFDFFKQRALPVSKMINYHKFIALFHAHIINIIKTIPILIKEYPKILLILLNDFSLLGLGWKIVFPAS